MVVDGHVVAVSLALALPVPPVEVAPVVDHLPLSAQKIGIADVRRLDGADAQILARDVGEQDAVGPQDGRASKGLVGDVQPLPLALGEARIARDEKARVGVLFQKCEHLGVEVVLVAVARKDEQGLFGI